MKASLYQDVNKNVSGERLQSMAFEAYEMLKYVSSAGEKNSLKKSSQMTRKKGQEVDIGKGPNMRRKSGSNNRMSAILLHTFFRRDPDRTFVEFPRKCCYLCW